MALKYGARLRRFLCRFSRLSALAAMAALSLNYSVLAAESEPAAEDDMMDMMDVEADEPPPFEHDFGTYIPTGRAVRIEPTEAPTIDGKLDDAAWAKAQVIDEFYQLDPDTGQPGSERTELRLLYDRENLYVGIYNFDREPSLISATNRSRDGNLGVDDSVRIYIDPLNTRRDAYFFEVNAAGARQDALIQNNSDFLKEWNTIWAGTATIVDDGWIVEMPALEGARVKGGETVVRIDDRIAKLRVDALKAQIEGIRSERARLKAESSPLLRRSALDRTLLQRRAADQGRGSGARAVREVLRDRLRRRSRDVRQSADHMRRHRRSPR